MWDPAKCKGTSICLQQHTVLPFYHFIRLPAQGDFIPNAVFFLYFFGKMKLVRLFFIFSFLVHLSLAQTEPIWQLNGLQGVCCNWSEGPRHLDLPAHPPGFLLTRAHPPGFLLKYKILSLQDPLLARLTNCSSAPSPRRTFPVYEAGLRYYLKKKNKF